MVGGAKLVRYVRRQLSGGKSQGKGKTGRSACASLSTAIVAAGATSTADQGHYTLYNAFDSKEVRLSKAEFVKEDHDTDGGDLSLLRWEKTYFYLSEGFGEVTAQQFVFAKLLGEASKYITREA